MSLHLRNRQRGFSLVEILVGAAIGLIGIVIIFQTLALTESRRRTTGAGSDTQLSGALALYTLERDLRLAGFGFSTAPELGCTVEATGPATATPPAPARGAFNFPLLPVQIVQGAAGAPDTLNVLWGNSPLFVNLQYFPASTATATTKVTQSSHAGLRPGDLVIAAGQVAGVTRCSLLEITATGADSKTITHTPGANYTNAAGAAVTAKYSSGASPPVFAAGGSLYNLGATPRRNIWSLSGSSLTVREDIANTAAISVADSIIDFQAEYGFDNNFGISPTPNLVWTGTDPVFSTKPAVLSDWRKLRAIRVALLSRSGEYEKTAVTPIAPVWIGNTTATAGSNPFVMRNVDGTVDTNPAGPNNWRNYRYRVHEAVIPLRNVIWGTSP